METERKLEELSLEAVTASRLEMLRILETVGRSVYGSSLHSEALNASQIAFENYADLHLKLISADNAGTSASLIRNAECAFLYKQRTDLLKTFLTDTKPDQEF